MTVKWIEDGVLHIYVNLGYIDLSKRRVSAEEVKKCEEKFTRGKTVSALICHPMFLSIFKTIVVSLMQ